MTNEQLVAEIRAGIDVPENTLQLWQQNRGYIIKVANYYKAYAEEQDLQQEGYLGLCAAIEHYRPEEGIPFITYAGYWIRQYFNRYIKKNGTVRIPEFMYDKIVGYERAVSKWKATLGRKPTDAEIRQYLGISQKQLENIKKNREIARISSLDVPVGEDGETTMCDLIPGKVNEEEQILDKIQKEQLSVLLWNIVDKLPAKQAEVIREKYKNGKTFKEIAEKMGISQSAANQRYREGMQKLRRQESSNLRSLVLEEEAYSKALKGTGVEKFKRTRESSTERAAIWLEEERKQLENPGRF